jgi:hypothetical protein
MRKYIIAIIMFVIFITIGCNSNRNSTTTSNTSSIKTKPSMKENTKATKKESKVETTSKKTNTTNTPTKQTTKQTTTRPSETIIEEELPEITNDHIFTGEYDINNDGDKYLSIISTCDYETVNQDSWFLIDINRMIKNKKYILKEKDLLKLYKSPELDYNNIILSDNMESFVIEVYDEDLKKNYIEVYNHNTKEFLYSYDLQKFEDGKYRVMDYNSSLSKALVYNFFESTLSISFYLLDLQEGSIVDIGLEDAYGYYKFSPDDKILFTCYPHILIYDIERKKHVKLLKPNANTLTSIKWTLNDEIIYTAIQFDKKNGIDVDDVSTYSYDLKTDTQELLGKNMLYNCVSRDGKYISYYYSDFYDNGSSISSNEYLYNYPVETFNIKNLETNEVYVFPAAFKETTHGDSLFINKRSQDPQRWFYIDSSFEIDESLYIDDYENENYNEYGYSDASSYLDHNYNPYNIKDGDKTTCWAEDQESQNFSDLDPDGSGIGEWVYFSTVRINKDTDFSYEVEKNLKGFKIINGYAKSESTYNTNNRVKEVEIEFSDKQRMTFNLEDNNMDFQTFYFPEEIKTRYFKLFIRDIYKGTKYNDTCISEIELIESDKGK